VTGPTRAERLAAPLAREALRQVTAGRGGCIRPTQLRRTDTTTGERTTVLVPRGSTLEAICPACARRAKNLRATQCREGWHLEAEPDLTPAPPGDGQQFWLTLRAETQVRRDADADAGQDVTDLDGVIEELDAELTAAGLRGTLTRTTGTSKDAKNGQGAKVKRSRSTRRRQDAPKLPRRRVAARTTGRVYRAPDGKAYRPSMFLTLTCDSYGKVRDDGSPVSPATYDYARAARDAVHFPALFDRLIQNLRRYLGYDVQYFATVEPQRRLAPPTSPSAARSPVTTCARSSPRPTTRSGGPPPILSASTGTSSRTGTRPPAATWTRPPGSCCRPGTRPWTPSAPPMSRCTWPGSARSSTPRASWPGPGTPAGASAT
jgi:hypothetical protein